MQIGFILIRSGPKAEHHVFEELNKIAEIKELHPLFGEFDFLAKIEFKDHADLRELVVNKIRIISGVVKTNTLTGLKRTSNITYPEKWNA